MLLLEELPPVVVQVVALRVGSGCRRGDAGGGGVKEDRGHFVASRAVANFFAVPRLGRDHRGDKDGLNGGNENTTCTHEGNFLRTLSVKKNELGMNFM